MIKIAVGSDHGGFEYKDKIIAYLHEKGYEVLDAGTYSINSCHYPTYGANAAKLVADGICDYGVVICTSGEGIMMAANKIKGIRCALGYNDEVAILARQHNNANMISFGAKFMAIDDVLHRIDLFLDTKFEGGRHQTRVDLISELEK